MTPVMLAAYKGHTGVVDMLVDQYNTPLTDVNKVSAFEVLVYQSPVQVCGITCQCLCPAVSFIVILHVVSIRGLLVTDILS